MKKFIFLALVATFSFAISPYVQGYRLYIRYVKHISTHELKAPVLLKKAGIKSVQQLDTLIKTGQIVPIVKKFDPKAAEGLKKALLKNKKALAVFLEAIYNGKIPPGCF